MYFYSTVRIILLSNLEMKRNSRAAPKLTLLQCAVKLVAMGVKNSSQFELLCRVKKRPDEIPSRPETFYANFPGWKAFILLGLDGERAGVETNVIPTYAELKRHLRRQGICTKDGYLTAYKNKLLLNNSPRFPERYYLKQWQGWSIFLAPNLKYVRFEEARRIARSFGLATSTEWKAFCREGKRPIYIPAMPHRDYSEFTSWNDFLIEPENS